MYAWFSMIMVILSVTLFILETHLIFQIDSKSRLPMTTIHEKIILARLVFYSILNCIFKRNFKRHFYYIHKITFIIIPYMVNRASRK